LTEGIVNQIFLDFIVLLIEAELRNSEIHGIGLFCREAIPRGTKVWAFNPLFDIVIDQEKLKSLPASVITFMKMYAYRSRNTGELIVNVDLSKHMNHSDTPNLTSDEDSNYYTVRDLPAGTELTCDYRAFCVEGCADFLDQPEESDERIFGLAAKG
ncbi:MAG: SET domain-containing protein-lysine N-methyltransferase, partial [Pseudomonadota bacterium]